MADDVPMMCACADDMQMTYPPADDVRMTYVICQPKSPTKSHSCVIRTLSVHRPHVVRTRLQFPDYFKLNSRGQLC